MKEMLDKIKAYALSNQDIQDILEPDTKIWVYPDFATMSSIDDAFDSLGRCVFLFLTVSPSVGHWLCMFKRGNNIIEYFDSYGEKPEAQRKWISEDTLEELGEEEPYLMNLLRASSYKVFWNTHAYQKDKQDYNTCGRWVVARLLCKDKSNLEFFNFVKSGMKEMRVSSPDDWVSLWTYEQLGK